MMVSVKKEALESISNPIVDRILGRAPCAPVSIHVATGIGLEEVIMQCVKHVPKIANKGMTVMAMKETLKSLGVEFVHTSIEDKTMWVRCSKEFGKRQRNARMDISYASLPTERRILSDLKEDATYILTSKKHAWVVRNHQTLDPVWDRWTPGKMRRITDMIEIVSVRGEAR